MSDAFKYRYHQAAPQARISLTLSHHSFRSFITPGMSSRQHPVSETSGRWPYSYCFVECCFQGLFNIARSILSQLPSSCFSIRFVSVHVVHPYWNIDTTGSWRKWRFILSDMPVFHVIDNQSIVVLAFPRSNLILLSVDETLLPKYVNMSTNYREKMSPSWLKRIYSVLLHSHVANATCCLLQTMQQGFGLGRCICKNKV